jgi:hypothetical protein
VPVEFSRDYVAHKAEVKMNLTEIESIGHFELIDPRTGIFGQISRVLTSLI